MMTKSDHLFIKLIEECAEVQQRATKLLQFGPKEIQPGQYLTNLQRLRFELNDLISIIVLLAEQGLIPENSRGEIDSHIEIKRERIEKYLKLSQELERVEL